jgi:hypothetical protein
LLAIVLQTAEAAAFYADAVGNSFPFMHCWNIMKDHPKWMEVRPTRTSRVPCDDTFAVDQVVDSNTADDFLEPSEAATSNGKRPMGQDAAKAARKKAASSSSGSFGEFDSNMKGLTIEKIGIMERSSNNKVEMDQERLELDKRRVANEEARERRQQEKEQRQQEKEHKEEEEHILSIDLEKCTPVLRIYYEALQEEILDKITHRRKPHD